MSDDLDPKSEAHDRKRDKKRATKGDELMRTGLSKTFHTIAEIRRRRAEAVLERQERERAKRRPK
jgi:hypothetical protein